MTICENCAQEIEKILDACHRPLWYGVGTTTDRCNVKEGYPYHEPSDSKDGE